MHPRIPSVALALVTAASLTACQAPPTPLASTSPPASTSTPTSTTKSKEELFAEASSIYRKMRDQMLKIEAQGGADELPSELKQYITGELEKDIAGVLSDTKKRGIRLTKKQITGWVHPHGKTLDGSVVAIAACEDGTKSRFQDQKGNDLEGSVAMNYFFFKYFDGRLKGFKAETEKVTKC